MKFYTIILLLFVSCDWHDSHSQQIQRSLSALTDLCAEKNPDFWNLLVPNNRINPIMWVIVVLKDSFCSSHFKCCISCCVRVLLVLTALCSRGTFVKKLQVMDNWNRPFGINPTVFHFTPLQTLWGLMFWFCFATVCQEDNCAGGHMVVLAGILYYFCVACSVPYTTLNNNKALVFIYNS